MKPHKPAKHVRVGDDIYITAHNHGPVQRIERHDHSFGRPGQWLAFIVDRDVQFAAPGANVHWALADSPIELHVEDGGDPA